MLLILRNALPLNASQALLRSEGESYEGRGSPLAGQGLQVVPLELKNLIATLVQKVQAVQGRKPAKDCSHYAMVPLSWLIRDRGLAMAC